MTEELKKLTEEQLKEVCKKLGLRGYSKLNEDEIIAKIEDSEKVTSIDEVMELLTNEEQKETKEETIKLFANRTLASNKGNVLGKFELTEKELESDKRILKALEIGFSVKV